MQCFDVDLRPAVDVEQFRSHGLVVLLDEDDVEETCCSAAELVDIVLNKLPLSAPVVEKARKILLTNDVSVYKH